MDNLITHDKFVHEKRIYSRDINYLRNVVTHDTHSANIITYIGIQMSL